MTRKKTPVPTKKSSNAPKNRQIIISGALDPRTLTSGTITAEAILATRILVAKIKSRSIQKKEN